MEFWTVFVTCVSLPFFIDAKVNLYCGFTDFDNIKPLTDCTHAVIQLSRPIKLNDTITYIEAIVNKYPNISVIIEIIMEIPNSGDWEQRVKFANELVKSNLISGISLLPLNFSDARNITLLKDGIEYFFNSLHQQNGTKLKHILHLLSINIEDTDELSMNLFDAFIVRAYSEQNWANIVNQLYGEEHIVDSVHFPHLNYNELLLNKLLQSFDERNISRENIIPSFELKTTVFKRNSTDECTLSESLLCKSIEPVSMEEFNDTCAKISNSVHYSSDQWNVSYICHDNFTAVFEDQTSIDFKSNFILRSNLNGIHFQNIGSEEVCGQTIVSLIKYSSNSLKGSEMSENIHRNMFTVLIFIAVMTFSIILIAVALQIKKQKLITITRNANLNGVQMH